MQNYKKQPFSGKDTGNGKDSYSADEVSKLIEQKVNEALKNARAEWDKDNESKIAAERDDAARLASMSAEERARAELTKRESAFAEEKQRYMSEKMEFEATKALAKENLPVTFAKILSGTDADATAENINLFKTEFFKAIEEALNERLKGKTPRTSSVVESSDPFLSGFGM